jgi:hypothetical protein
MTISIWGWGSCCGAISTWGWGTFCCGNVPEMWAKYLSDSYAYSCVLTRNYIEIQSRPRGLVLLRVSPDKIPERYRTEILKRIAVITAVRSRNVQLLKRDYANILSRLRGDITLRVRSGKITERTVSQISQRIAGDVPVRSPGWPFQSDEICE